MNQRDLNLIELIIEASNSNFFSRFAKLLRLPYPATKKEKTEMWKRVIRAWEGGGQGG